MNMIPTFQEFLASQSVQVSVFGFFVNLLASAILAVILASVYVKYGNALSNRSMFAKNFVLLTMTTMLIISVVKSSLALSLGLVGALSIVRFRSPIKEPEELTYLFLAIAIGLGFGADQGVITVVAFAIIVGIIWAKHFFRKSAQEHQNIHITITSQSGDDVGLKEIVDTLKETCTMVNLKRFDETKDVVEASFLVDFDDFDELQKAKSALQKLNKNINITFLDNRGLY